MRQFLWLGCLFCCLVCVSCTSAKSKTTSSQIPPLENGEVERVYGLYQQGQYAAYVAVSARVVKLTPSANGRQTNVTLRVNYRTQTHEEILLSFVWVKDRWRLR